MTHAEAFQFITQYFKRLFTDHDVQALDEYLHPRYWDDDIGQTGVDHIRNSKEYLSKLFHNVPTIGVEVHATVVKDDVITSYLEWFHLEHGHKITRLKCIGIFVMDDGKIRKRHTYIYYMKDGLQVQEP